MTNYPPPSPTYLGPPYRKSAGDNKPIKRIVLHGTVSPTMRGGARQIAAYFRGSSAGGSAHYVVDPGEVIQAAYDSVICWHAPPNGNSIGVEMCDMVGVGGGPTPLPMSRWDSPDHKAMLKLTARLVAELCLAYDVPARMVGPLGLKAGRKGICEHSDVSEAFRQSSHWDVGNFPRRRFIRQVRAEVAAIKAGATETAEVKPTLVTEARDLLEQAVRNARKKARKRSIERGLSDLPRR